MAAAALIVLFISVFAVYRWRIDNTVQSKVILDVNPSIYINVNAKEKVLSVEPGNEDGKKIIGDMDLRNTSLNVAVNALIGSMLRNGYLTDMNNAILVSVENDDIKKGSQLQVKLTETIEQMLADSQLEPVVFAQTVTENQDIKELADKYGISEGKAALIKELISQDNKLTFEELAPLSVHEIALIIESKSLDTKDVTKTGHASQKAYIGKEKAREIAFAHAKKDASQVTEEDIEFDVEDGIMVYEIEFNVGTVEYEYDINALTGEIIHYSKESDDDNDTNTENTNNNTSESAFYIGKEKAKAAAFDHAGVTENHVNNLEIDFDYEDKKAVYEIEFETDDAEYEYVIDAVTGKILGSERDIKRSSGSNKRNTSKQTYSPPLTTNNPDKYIGKEKAKEIAFRHAKVDEGKVKDLDIELDIDDGRAVYEIDFKAGNKEYDYEIDAATGDILKSETDIDD